MCIKINKDNKENWDDSLIENGLRCDNMTIGQKFQLKKSKKVPDFVFNFSVRDLWESKNRSKDAA